MPFAVPPAGVPSPLSPSASGAARLEAWRHELRAQQGGSPLGWAPPALLGPSKGSAGEPHTPKQQGTPLRQTPRRRAPHPAAALAASPEAPGLLPRTGVWSAPFSPGDSVVAPEAGAESKRKRREARDQAR